MRQPLCCLRRTNAEAGIVLMAMVTGQVGEKPAPGREHARERLSVQALRMQLRDEAANLRRPQLPQGNRPRQYQQRPDVALVAPNGMRAKPSLMGKVFKIALEQDLAGWQARFLLPQLAPTHESKCLFHRKQRSIKAFFGVRITVCSCTFTGAAGRSHRRSAPRAA